MLISLKNIAEVLGQLKRTRLVSNSQRLGMRSPLSLARVIPGEWTSAKRHEPGCRSFHSNSWCRAHSSLPSRARSRLAAHKSCSVGSERICQPICSAIGLPN